MNDETTSTDPNTGTSPNPDLNAPSNAPAANPPAPGDEPRIVAPIDEVQREIDGDGKVAITRSLASAGQSTTDGVTGAPDGIGADLEGGVGQSVPEDTTEEAAKSKGRKSKPKS